MKNDKQPKIVSCESEIHKVYFLCPVCGKVYTATLATSTVYDKPIDGLNEGVVFTPQYMCRRCHSYAFEIDKDILHLVRSLRSAGIETVGCCAGHTTDDINKSDFGEPRYYSLPDDEDDGRFYYGSYVAIDPSNIKGKLTNDDIEFITSKLISINTEGENVPVRVTVRHNSISGYILIHSLYTLPVFENMPTDLQKVALGWTRDYLERFCREAIIPVFTSHLSRKRRVRLKKEVIK